MAKQLSFKNINGWGGKRKGAGRKNRTNQVAHSTRDKVLAKNPMHITMRARKGLVNLRTQGVFKEFKRALKEAKRFGLSVNQFSLQGNHLHLVVEAKSNASLASGMKSFGSRFAKAVLRASGQKGAAFAGRYHLHILKSPRETKNALKYVLLNQAQHIKVVGHIDAYSSGYYFSRWHKLVKVSSWIQAQLAEPRARDFSHRAPAKSWLLREGWLKASG